MFQNPARKSHSQYVPLWQQFKKKLLSYFNIQIHVLIIQCIPWLLDDVNMINCNCNVWFRIYKSSWSIWLKSLYDYKIMLKAHKTDRNLSLYGNSVVYVTESIVCGHNIQPPLVNNSVAVSLWNTSISLAMNHLSPHLNPVKLFHSAKKSFSKCLKYFCLDFYPVSISLQHLNKTHLDL